MDSDPPPSYWSIGVLDIFSYRSQLGICASDIFFLSETQPSNDDIGSNINGITLGGYRIFLKTKVTHTHSLKSQMKVKSL